MRTLLITLEYPPFKGGVANYYENIVKNWSDPSGIFVLDNSKQKLVKKIAKWLPAIFNIKKEIKQKNIKHVIVGNILPLGTVALILSRFINFKFTVVLHGTDIQYSQKSKRKKLLVKMVLSKSKNIICNSKFTALLVSEYYNNKFDDKISIVNPGIDIRKQKKENPSHPTEHSRKQDFIKKYNLEGKFILFSISRLINRKGIDKVIEVMPKLMKKIPNLIYVVAGTGPDEEVLKNLSKGKNVIFLGSISEEDKWTWLQICDTFILPSREEGGNMEGFGIVYLEANLSEKAVIAGKHGGVGDAVAHNQTGLLIDPENNDEIKTAILKLYKNPDLRKELGRKGKERSIKMFNWKKQVNKIENIINRD